MTLQLEPIPTPESPLSRCDPRWKLAALVLAGALTIPLQTVGPALVACIGAMVLALMARMPIAFWLSRLAVFAPFLCFFVLLVPFLYPGQETWLDLGFVQVSGKGMKLAALISLKAVALATLMLVVLVSAPVPTTLHAAQQLRVPGLLILLCLLTYRYVFFWIEELLRIRTALRVRGFRSGANLHSYRTFAHVTGTLLVRGSERADRVAQAMRCRGFDGHFHSLTEFQTTGADLLLFAAIVAGFGGLLAVDLALK